VCVFVGSNFLGADRSSSRNKSAQTIGEIMPNYGYYIPLSEKLFDSVRLISIEPKTEGIGPDAPQKTDKDGIPVWVITALVKFQGGASETETFTISANKKGFEEISAIPELTPIRLAGLSGGKWSRSDTDRTNWTFQITGLAVL